MSANIIKQSANKKIQAFEFEEFKRDDLTKEVEKKYPMMFPNAKKISSAIKIKVYV